MNCLLFLVVRFDDTRRGRLMDTIRFGLIGLGNIGTLHYSYLSEIQGARLTAVCDIDESRFKSLGAKKDFDHDTTGVKGLDKDIETFRDYRAMLDSGKVDAIIVAVPHYFHPEMSIEAFKRGIHVICEKPVAITAREARMMNQAYQDSNVVFSAMFQMRTEPAFIKLKEIIGDGTLGAIRRINWIITNWFRTQSYYDSGGWRGTWTGEGGGVLMNQCPHNLDMFQYLFGMPVKLTAMAYLGKWHDVTVEDDISVIMEMENGATASFVTTTADTPGTNRLEIAAENGKLVLEGGRMLFYKTEAPVQEIVDHSEKGFYSGQVEKIDIEIEPKPAGHKYITQNVVNAILGKEQLIAPGTEGIKSVQLANAMLLAGLKGKQVEVPVPEEEYDELLAELRQDERENAPDKVFDWDEYLRQLA